MISFRENIIYNQIPPFLTAIDIVVQITSLSQNPQSKFPIDDSPIIFIASHYTCAGHINNANLPVAMGCS